MVKKPKFQFGNVVVVDKDKIGLICKTWDGGNGYSYDVYVRSSNGIREYSEDLIDHFVFSKELTKKELEFY